MVQKQMGPQGTLLFFQRTVQIACNNFKTYTLWNDFVLQRYISFLRLTYFTPVKQTSGTAGFYRIILKLFLIGSFFSTHAHSFCILAKIHSHLQGLITISPKSINPTLTVQEFPRPTAYRIVVQTLRSSRPFFKGLSFLIHLTTRSSTLNPFPLLRKNWRLNYWVNMKTVHKSFHLRLFAIFSSIDVKQL